MAFCIGSPRQLLAQQLNEYYNYVQLNAVRCIMYESELCISAECFSYCCKIIRYILVFETYLVKFIIEFIIFKSVLYNL